MFLGIEKTVEWGSVEHFIINLLHDMRVGFTEHKMKP